MLSKKLASAILSLSIILGCSDNVDLQQTQEFLNTQPISTEPISAYAENDLMNVKFNNAYAGLYKENEKNGRNDPNNPDKIFVRLVKAAKKTIDVAVFDIEEPTTTQALINAHKKGVRVRVLTDTDNLNDKVYPSKKREAIEALMAARIPVVDDRRTAFMHHKFVIIDDNIVLTGSLNLTINSLYRDNNNALRIISKQLADNYKAEFNRMFEQGLLGPNPHEIPYPEVKVGNSTVRVYFSPKGGTREAVAEELRKAKVSIKFMAFSLTDLEIDTILFDKFKQGLKVEGIFDGCMLSKYSLYQKFLENKIPAWIDGNQALLHNKVFIIDNQTIITGSYNFSKNAENNNNENTLIIHSPQLALNYNQEYGRLKWAAQKHTNLPPYDNRKCGSQDNGNDDTVVLDSSKNNTR